MNRVIVRLSDWPLESDACAKALVTRKGELTVTFALALLVGIIPSSLLKSVSRFMVLARAPVVYAPLLWAASTLTIKVQVPFVTPDLAGIVPVPVMDVSPAAGAGLNAGALARASS